jgi:hypothetical protein
MYHIFLSFLVSLQLYSPQVMVLISNANQEEMKEFLPIVQKLKERPEEAASRVDLIVL